MPLLESILFFELDAQTSLQVSLEVGSNACTSLGLCLQRRQIIGKSLKAQLGFSRTSFAHLPENRSPNWHFPGSVGHYLCFSADGFEYAVIGKLALVALGEGSQIGGHNLENDRNRPVALAVDAVAICTIRAKHLGA